MDAAERGRAHRVVRRRPGNRRKLLLVRQALECERRRGIVRRRRGRNPCQPVRVLTPQPLVRFRLGEHDDVLDPCEAVASGAPDANVSILPRQLLQHREMLVIVWKGRHCLEPDGWIGVLPFGLGFETVEERHFFRTFHLHIDLSIVDRSIRGCV